MQLVLPSIKYEKSFLEALAELRKEGRKREIEDGLIRHYDEIGNLADFVAKLKGQAEGEFLPEGYVPHTVYWLVEGEEFIGWCDIRHRLTEHLLEIGGHIGYAIRPSERQKGNGNKILELALLKARDLGIMKVRISCDEDNIASAKIIEKNGGVFDSTAKTKEGVIKRRYWIPLEAVAAVPKLAP